MTMNIVTGLILILCGVFAVSALAARLQPDRRAAIDVLAAFQGYVGLPTAVWGAWAIVLSVWRNYQAQSNPVWWATFLGTGIFELVLGLILTVGLLARPATGGATLRLRLSAVEIPLGLLAIVAGFWCFIAAFAYFEF